MARPPDNAPTPALSALCRYSYLNCRFGGVETFEVYNCDERIDMKRFNFIFSYSYVAATAETGQQTSFELGVYFNRNGVFGRVRVAMRFYSAKPCDA
jgi:hypothetical protein